MKGIILAGGSGSRLQPLTSVVSKQLLPVFDKPLIYYPLSTLMLAGIQDICIITDPTQTERFVHLLGDGSRFGIRIEFLEQREPRGIAESLIIAEDFIGDSSTALILGDNIFHGPGLGRRLSAFSNVSGARVFGYHVNDPSSYGVLITDQQGKILKIVEKPTQFISHIAIPGLYFFDAQASRIAKAIRPSARGELEITEVLSRYLENGELDFEMLPRGTSWFDSGTFSDLHDAATFVRLMQERTGEQVGNPFDVSEAQGWK